MKSVQPVKGRPMTCVKRKPVPAPSAVVLEQSASAPQLAAQDAPAPAQLRVRSRPFRDMSMRTPFEHENEAIPSVIDSELRRNTTNMFLPLSLLECGDQKQAPAPVVSSDTVDSPPTVRRRCSVPVRTVARHTPRSGRNCKTKNTLPHRTPAKSTVSITSNVHAQYLSEIFRDTRKSARIIKDSRTRLLDLQKKSCLTAEDIKELTARHALLLTEMHRFEQLVRNVQIAGSVAPEPAPAYTQLLQDNTSLENIHGTDFEPAFHHEMLMQHYPAQAQVTDPTPPDTARSQFRSNSEIDLTRKLSESYDMQEKLVADNADLEVKRYVLYKELMTKDQGLEIARAQVARLQAELRLLTKENGQLRQWQLDHQAKGDAADVNKESTCPQESSQGPGSPQPQDNTADTSESRSKGLAATLDKYKNSNVNLENILVELEFEVRNVKIEMDEIKHKHVCTDSTVIGGGGPPGAGPGSLPCGGGAAKCYQKRDGPPEPPTMRVCGTCPPCPSVCNPQAPPTPAELEVAKLRIQLRQTEEGFKQKVTECAMLRSELLSKKEELEKERCEHRAVRNKLRMLEMRLQGLAMQTSAFLGSKEQAFEQEVSMRTLKQCYRDAREEIDELRKLIKEQSEQLQDYRVKFLQAQQTVEEQKHQLDLMDMDNARISEQINLEIQKVKVKFQDKLQELAPIPDMLKATQLRLKDAQNQQALAEHTAEQLARELHIARERVHVLTFNALKSAQAPETVKQDDKLVNQLQTRISQLTEQIVTLKQEIERLKNNVIKMEESVLISDKRLQEKMHECAVLGGELDRSRDDCARALARANERTETVRKCLQTTIAELENQLAYAKAQQSRLEKEREELRERMQCQVRRLNDNYQVAQNRVMTLTDQIAELRRGDGSVEDHEDEQCKCRSLFQD